MNQPIVLDNGLVVLVNELPHTRSVTLLIYVGVGARYEAIPVSGVSHFVEHMFFKGTTMRPTARTISAAIEGVGGAFNASTSHELTSYYARVAYQHFPLALDVLSDMLRNSVFEPAEIEKERKVIIEEINETFDDPSDLVGYDLDALMWPAHRLGGDVAGTADTVRALTREGMREYMAQHYGPRNMVISVAGMVQTGEVVAQIEKAFAGWGHGQHGDFELFRDGQEAPRLHVRYKDTEQAQIAFCLWGLPRDHPDRFVLRVANTILGVGMSSRLFQEIREKRGLAYDVGSHTLSLYDCGGWGAGASVEPKQAVTTLQAILGEWERMRGEPVSDEELTLAKEFMKGRLFLSMEDTFSVASWYGRQQALGAEMLTPEDVAARIDAVTAEDIQRIAGELFRNQALNLAVVGPFRGDKKFAAALKA